MLNTLNIILNISYILTHTRARTHKLYTRVLHLNCIEKIFCRQLYENLITLYIVGFRYSGQSLRNSSVEKVYIYFVRPPSWVRSSIDTLFHYLKLVYTDLGPAVGPIFEMVRMTFVRA